MCDPVSIGIGSLVLGGVGTAMQMQQAKKADKNAKQANQQAKDNAEATLAQADQDMNRRNAKQPNVAALQTANSATAAQGNTLLSGAGGVDYSKLPLGTNTILGR